MGLSGKFISKFSSFNCFRIGLTVIFIFFITNKGYSQSKPLPVKDSTAQKADTLKLGNGQPVADTNKKAVADTSKRSQLEQQLGIKISKDALSSVVTADAADSAVLDMEHNLFYLYGKAKVKYEDMQLTAGQVTYQQERNTVTAAPYELVKDTTDKQIFTQGKEKFTYDSMQYNFKSKRAIVRNVHSQYGEGFVYSEQVKRNPDQTIYGAHSIYTTCALDTPHFGIVARKIKVIPGKLIVSGPAHLSIEGVPTPLMVPFGLFPASQRQRSGFVLPTYTVEQNRGLGLLNGGYYFYLNDHADLQVQTDLYTKGSYGIRSTSNYSTRYRFTGGIGFSYFYNKTGEDFEPGASIKKDFMFNWRHQSDAKAVPGQTFNASVTAGTSSFYSNNSYDANQILNNQYQSNISYAKNWTGKPFGLTISALHNQNTQTRLVSVTLPSINFHVTQLNPFQRSNSIGTHWYDKITTSYNVDMLNKTDFYDSTFSFAKLAADKFQTGIHHSVPVSAAYTVARYIQMSFNVNYNEYWLTDKLIRGYNDATGLIDTADNHGFYTARDFNAGITFSTRIYGMKLFKHGSLKGIRHVLTPSIGASYHPDFAAAPFNYYYRARLDSTQNYVYLSPYATSIVGVPPIGKSGQLNYGLNNNLQIKVRSSKDTVSGYKNVTLIDGLSANGSYNFAADSFKWSNISLNFRTNVMDKINISASATANPYKFDYQNGRNIDELMVTDGGGLARITNSTVSFGSNLHSKPKGGAKNPTNSEEYTRVMRNAGYNEYVDFNIPWSFNFSYSLNANRNYSSFSHRDTTVLSQTLTFSGEIQVTTRWKVAFNSGYNFDQHELTYTSIDVFRDLHCWQMHLQTIPFGARKSYNFSINVKSTVLQDLKLVRRRDYRDVVQ